MIPEDIQRLLEGNHQFLLAVLLSRKGLQSLQGKSLEGL